MKALLAVHRSEHDGASRVDTFAVEFEHGQSVLDGLRMIRRDQDPSLAFRFSCINANACKECMMLIDGEVEYACTARLKEGTTALAPLPKKALIRDLVTEIAPPDERLERLPRKK
jgi:succinate dehydrogenase/fumarate reductase-like Fe-S protein